MHNTYTTLTVSERAQSLADKNTKICCIIPVYNEALNIGKFLTELNQYLSQFSSDITMLCINDGSTDNSQEIIEGLIDTLPIQNLDLSRNFGKEKAIAAGLDHCNADVGILIDGDFQHPFVTIKDFLEQWGRGYDMVYGVRENRQGETLIKRLLTRRFYQIIRYTSQVNIVPNAGDFRLLDTRVVHALSCCQEKNKLMKGLYAWVGYKSIGVPYECQPREQGKSTFNFASLLELSITGITAFSNIPLRIWTMIGVGISTLSFIYAIYIILITTIFGADLPGYSSIMVGIFFFGGIQLVSIGILGEYIARIFNEVKNRPSYILKSKNGFN